MDVRTRFNQIWSELNEAKRLIQPMVRNDPVLDAFSEHEDKLFVVLVGKIDEARGIARDLAVELILDDEGYSHTYPSARESRRAELVKDFI